MPDLTERLAAAADAHKAESLGFLASLIALQRDGEAAVQARVAERCQALGCEVEQLRYAPPDIRLRGEFAATEAVAPEPRVSVVARRRGVADGRSLIFFAHPDGEPISGTGSWRHDPFGAVVAHGRIHGWGVADDLAGVAAQVMALEVLHAAGLSPRGDVLLASTPSKRHARGVAAVMQHGFLADAAVYMHPAESGVGMREVKAIAGGQLYLRVTVAGRAPDTTEPGHTAFAHLAVNPLDAAFRVIEALRRLDADRATRIRHPAIDAAVGRSTNILVSHLACGDANRFSRIAPEATLGVAISFPPGEALASVQAEVEAAIAGIADPWLRDHPPRLEWLSGVTGAEVPPGHPLFATVSEAVLAVTGSAPHVNPLHTSSDIRNPMVQHGIPCVGLGPLCGDLSQNGRHDEWVDVADYHRCVEVAARTIAGWCGVS